MNRYLNNWNERLVVWNRTVIAYKRDGQRHVRDPID